MKLYYEKSTVQTDITVYDRDGINTHTYIHTFVYTHRYIGSEKLLAGQADR